MDVLFVTSHMTNDDIDVRFTSDGSHTQVHPKFAQNKILDLTFPNKQALDNNAISIQRKDTQ